VSPISSVPDLVVSANLTRPGEERGELVTLPTWITSSVPGLYRIDAVASRPGYKDATAFALFAGLDGGAAGSR
jgi:hypothetical protein